MMAPLRVARGFTWHCLAVGDARGFRCALLAAFGLVACDRIYPYEQRVAPSDRPTEASDLRPPGARDAQNIDGAPTTNVCVALAGACAGALKCERFEATGGLPIRGWGMSVGSWQGLSLNPGSALTVVNDPVCRGTHALKASGDGAAQLVAIAQWSLTANPIYVRVYMNAHITEPAAAIIYSEASPGRLYQLLVGPNDSNGFSVERPNQLPTLDFRAPFVTDRWTCVELMLALDATAGEVALWIDGKEIGAFREIPMPGAPHELYIGISTGSAHRGTSYILYDDVAVATSRIGC